jgi:hypothetical protein
LSSFKTLDDMGDGDQPGEDLGEEQAAGDLKESGDLS